MHSSDTGKKMKQNEIEHQLFRDFKKANDSFKKKVLYNIFTDFGIPTKSVWLIKMCSNEPYSKVCKGKICLVCFLSKCCKTR